VIKDMEKAMSVIQTGISMKGNLNEGKLTVKEFIIGLQEKYMMGNGKTE
jgi:hypothetical protein